MFEISEGRPDVSGKGEPIIEFNNVTKIYTLYKNSREQFKALFIKSRKYKRSKALDGVDFKIYRGESVAIIGKNGAGKSTVLKMITGVAFPTTGEVKVKGRVAALLELTAGFVPDMTGRENISFKCYVLGKKKCKAKIKELISRDITVLYVSHGRDIREVCKRCIFLQKGKVIFDGGMEETLNKYPEFGK